MAELRLCTGIVLNLNRAAAAAPIELQAWLLTWHLSHYKNVV